MLTADRWDQLWWEAFDWGCRYDIAAEVAARWAWSYMLRDHGDPPPYDVVEVPARPYPESVALTIDLWQVELLRRLYAGRDASPIGEQQQAPRPAPVAGWLRRALEVLG